MKGIFSAFVVFLCIAWLSSCGSQSKSNPGVDISGNWNVDLTESGQSTPSYSFGLKFTKNAATITGSEIAYTGGTPPSTTCINYGGLTASGSTNGSNVVTLVVKDPSTNSTFTISGTADAPVAQINGSYTGTFGANGSNPPCSSSEGTVLMNRQ